MVDPHQAPDTNAGEVTSSLPSLGPRTEWKDPIAAEIHAWLGDFVKAAKSLRVYADNNEMLARFLDKAYLGLTNLLAKLPELNLSLREDRILFGKDAVLVSADRQDGLPFLFYRNAFRRLTLVQGMDRDEMVKLMKAVVADYSSYDFAGEDLVTALWRLALPHLRYLTIDALSVDSKASKNTVEREDIDRIQGDIEDIVAAIYDNNASDEDIVAGVSITKEDLEALKDIRKETEEELDLLDQVTARAIASIAPAELREIQSFLTGDNRDALVRRLTNILVRILFKEQSARESSATIELLVQLFDSMIVSQRYAHGTELIMQLRQYSEHSQSMQELHIARHLLKMFSTESRVLPALAALQEGYKGAKVHEMVGFLRALGPAISPVLIGALDNIAAPAQRRIVCDLVAELGIPDVQVLTERSANAKWFVVRDLLGLAQRYPLDRIAGLIYNALRHEHPKVRNHAVGMLRGYSRGTADKLLVDRLTHDPDLEVRLTACRVAATRRSPEAKAAMEKMLTAPDLADRDPKELRSLMAAYALIGGDESVPALDRVLSPGLLASFKNPEPQLAAAVALGLIGTPTSHAALQRGSRTLNSKVREAVKRALTRAENAEEVLADKRAKEATDVAPIEVEETSGYVLSPFKGALEVPTPSSPLAAPFPPTPSPVTPTQTANIPTPDFRLGAPEPVKAPVVPAVNAPRPSMPHASKGSDSSDIMPERLPPPLPAKHGAVVGKPEAPSQAFALETAATVPVAEPLRSTPPEPAPRVAVLVGKPVPAPAAPAAVPAEAGQKSIDDDLAEYLKSFDPNAGGDKP